MIEQASRILIIDDDEDFSESTAAFLRAQGFEVVQAYSGEEGLKAARRERPDLILMDVMMGERTEGFFTVQRLRREEGLADVPVVVISSLYDDDPAFDIAPDRGWLRHDAFLPKPLDLDALLTTLAAQLPGVGGEAS